MLSIASCVIGLNAAGFAAPLHAQELSVDEVKALIADRAAAHGIPAYMLECVIAKESRFKPTARGRQLEDGLAQWLPGRGNAWDNTSAHAQGINIEREYALWRNGEGGEHAPYYDVDGMAELFARGRAFRH